MPAVNPLGEQQQRRLRRPRQGQLRSGEALGIFFSRRGRKRREREDRNMYGGSNKSRQLEPGAAGVSPLPFTPLTRTSKQGSLRRSHGSSSHRQAGKGSAPSQSAPAAAARPWPRKGKEGGGGCGCGGGPLPFPDRCVSWGRGEGTSSRASGTTTFKPNVVGIPAPAAEGMRDNNLHI